MNASGLQRLRRHVHRPGTHLFAAVLCVALLGMQLAQVQHVHADPADDVQCHWSGHGNSAHPATPAQPTVPAHLPGSTPAAAVRPHLAPTTRLTAYISRAPPA